VPEKVVIIGSGPAGWSAAIYAARANLDPVVVEGTVRTDVQMIPLGQLAFTTEVENYPGFPFGNIRAFVESAVDEDRHYNLPPIPNHPKEKKKRNSLDQIAPHYAVQGIELMELMKQQAINFETRIISDDVVDIDVSSGVKKVMLRNGDPIDTHTIIVATGARANWLGLESEEKYKNKGVSACAVCDGALPVFYGKPLAVVGGGDSAVEEAAYLANLKGAKKVYMIVRRDELRASKIMAERAINHPKIEILWNSVVEEVVGDEETDLVSGIKLKSTKDGSISDLEVGGMFVAIGHTPNTDFLSGKLEMNDKGYLIWKVPFRTNTSAPGVYAAGDVADDYYRQAITSAGTGCMAALDVERYLVDEGIE